MTERPQPTPITHFTHVDHLAKILDYGLLSDSAAQSEGLLSIEVGNVDIKDQRRNREVPLSMGGNVSDYVPFYFAVRSPMMSAIENGKVPTYTAGTARLIYLVTTLERLQDLGHHPILTDRNAALKYAAYREFDTADPLDDGFIDWDVMKATYWNDHHDGRERRMAEALVHDRVGFEAFTSIGVQNGAVAAEVRECLVVAGSSIPVKVVPRWYF